MQDKTEKKTIEALPDFMAGLLAEKGLKAQDVRLCVHCDMTQNLMFGRVYLLAFADMVLVLTLSGERMTTMGGFVQRKKEKLPAYRVEEYETIDFDAFDKLLMIPAVIGGVVCVEQDGERRPLCAYTNDCTGKLSKFCSLVEKLKKGEPLLDRDFDMPENPRNCPKCGTPYIDRERQICPKCNKQAKAALRLLSYFKPFWKQVVLVLFFIVLSTVFALAWPYINGALIYDGVFGKSGALAGKIGTVVLLVAGLTVVEQVFTMMQGRITASFMPMVTRNIQTDLFKKLETLSLSFFSKAKTGSLMRRVLDDCNNVMYFFIDTLPYAIINAIKVVVPVVVLFTIDWRFGLIILTAIPFLVILVSIMYPRIYKVYDRASLIYRKMSANVSDNITGARVVRAFGRSGYEEERFTAVNESYRRTHNKAAYTDIFTSFVLNAFFMVVRVLCWGIAGYAVLNGQVTFGLLMTFIGYIDVVVEPVVALCRFSSTVAQNVNAAARVFEILDAHSDVKERHNPVRLPHMRGEIELSHVTFGYDESKTVLEDISFHVQPGQTLGIVGHSGAGKTTLVSLISRLYDVSSGEIKIDGINIKDLAFSDLRRSIALISQETYIFIGTVWENIAYAKPDATREEIVAAAVAANAHEFITKLPDGYDTLLGNVGHGLSGGQRQRLSIARALLADPKILILDEATASVDTATERRIQESLAVVTRGRTTLSIAHRLSTLRDADYLVVIEKGKIAEEGTHLELAKKKGIYYRLMQLQSKSLAMRGISDEQDG